MATSNEKQVQLKRETLLNDEAVLEDIFPKTMTDAVVDPNSGMSMSEMLDMIMTVINNKLSRIVNSVNGRSGVVLLSAADVGLGNVDNVSNADLKAWVINYVAEQFHGKHLILRDYYSGIQALIDTGNDVYDGVPYVCKHLTDDANDETMVIGYMYLNDGTLTDEKFTFDFGNKGVGRFEYDSNSNVLGEYFNIYDEPNRNRATGLYSTSKGYKNIADAQASMVCGSENEIHSSAVNSFVVGSSNECYGNDSILGGHNNSSSGDHSFVIGEDNQNKNEYSKFNIIGGEDNIITNSGSSLIAGRNNQTTQTNESLVVGNFNRLTSTGDADIYEGMIVGGTSSQSEDTSNSIITGYAHTSIASSKNAIFGTGNKSDTADSSLICGILNTIKSTSGSSITGFVGGSHSVVSGNYATAIGDKVEGKGNFSFIIGISSHGSESNQESVIPVGQQQSIGIRYNGIGTMTLTQILKAHKESPFSLSYGLGSFVAGKDNLGIGDCSVTIGNHNINKSEGSLVSGYNNTACAAKGMTVLGTNNFVSGQFSTAGGVRNTTSGHVATALGAFNDATNYSVALGIGSQLELDDRLEIPDFDNKNLFLKYSTKYSNFQDDGRCYTMQQWISRSLNYIDIPLPLLFCPMELKDISLKITYSVESGGVDENVWISDIMDSRIFEDPTRDVFSWEDDIKALRLTKSSLVDRFVFTHTTAPGYDYNLNSIDLRDANFFIQFTAVPNIAEKVWGYALKIGNGPFADSMYLDAAGHADSFKVDWYGRTYTQKDMILTYKADPNTSDPPVQISIKKLIDTLIAGNYITLQDIQF